MKIVIANKLKVLAPPPELRQYLKDLLTLPNPEYESAKKFRRPTFGIPKELIQYELDGKHLEIPRGLLEHLVEDLGLEFEIEDHTVAPVAPRWPKPLAVLRPDDQAPAVDDLLRFSHGFLQAPAGTGKTVIALEVCRRLGLKTLWLTHQTALKNQVIQEAVNLFGLREKEIGVLHGQKWRIGERLTVGMLPTLRRRDISALAEEFGLVVIDEAHHVPCQSFLTVLSQLRSRHIYGFTATAYRSDGLENLMFNAVGPIRTSIQHRALFEDEHLIKPEIVIRSTGWFPSNAEELEYNDFMEKMVVDDYRNLLIARDVIQENQPGNKFIVLVERTRHAEILTKLLKSYGVACDYVVGSIDAPPKKNKKGELVPRKKIISQTMRNQTLDDFREGRLDGLVATWDLLAEGFNYRPLNRLFLASPVRYRGTVTQAIGRVQRPAEGKTEARVWDYADDLIVMFDRQVCSRIVEVYQAMEMPIRRLGQEDVL